MKNHLVLMANNSLGFTLLELLLVLTLLTALTVSGLGMYEIKLRNFKVDKTALQMQQWLQAGLSFYLDCQKWPMDSQQDSNIIPAMMGESAYTQVECPTLVNQKRMYMPQGSDQNGPWTYTDEDGKTFENHYDIAPIKNPDGTDSKVFSVSTVIGYEKTLQSSAQMIAGRLPNATTSEVTPVGQKPIWVQAYVNAGGGGAGGNGGYLVNMQNVSSQTVSQIKSTYQCPAGMEYKVYYGLSQVHVGPDILDERFGVYASSYSSSAKNGFVVPNLNIEGNCQAAPDKCSNNGSTNQVLLIGACMPIVNKSNASPLSTSGNNSGNNYARY